MDKKEFVNRDLIVKYDHWYSSIQNHWKINLQYDRILERYTLNLFLPFSIFWIHYTYRKSFYGFEVMWTLKINHKK